MDSMDREEEFYLFVQSVIDAAAAEADKRAAEEAASKRRESGFSQCSTSSQSIDAKKEAISRLFEVQAKSLAENGENILQENQRQVLKGNLVIAKNIFEYDSEFKWQLSSKMVKIKNLPLEVIWWLQIADIMSLNFYIGTNLSDSDQLERIGNGLHELMCCPSGDGIKGAVTASLLDELNGFVHGPEPPLCIMKIRGACGIILGSIYRKQLAAFNDNKGGTWWLKKLIGPSSTLPIFVRTTLAINLLRMKLWEVPFMSLHQAFNSQAAWNYKDSPQNLTSFFSLTLTAAETEPNKALDILKSVLKYDVNWRAIITYISTFLNTFPDAATRLSNFLMDVLQRAFDRCDEEDLTIAIIFARQCAVESAASGFLSYSAWFMKTFCTQKSSPLTTVTKAKFFLKFLVELVPHEPKHCLRAHVEETIYVPVSCKDIVQDYITLAKTRLKDLSNKEKPTGFFPNKELVNLQEQAKFDVQKALSHFESTGKIHPSLFQGYIFKRKYFDTHFLSELLTPRKTSSTNDTQMLLIDKLLAEGKISSLRYNAYHEQQQSLAAEGVL